MPISDSEQSRQLGSAVRPLHTPVAIYAATRDASGVITAFTLSFANDAARADLLLREGAQVPDALPAALDPLFPRLCAVVDSGAPLQAARVALPAADGTPPAWIDLQADRAGGDALLLLWYPAGDTASPASVDDLHARAEELQQLLDAAPAAIWIAHDPECRRITGSRFAAELLRMRPGDNLSKSAGPEAPRHFTVRVNGRDLEPHELPVQRAARGEEVRDFEEELVFEDGSRRSLFGSALPLRDGAGQARGAISAFVDVTALKQAEARMREAQQAAEAASRLKDQFLATLSHELRTPLNAIIGYTSMLKAGTVPPERTAQALAVIERNGRVQLRLVEDLLDVSRMTAGTLRLTMEPLCIREEVVSAIEAVQPVAEEKGLVLRASFDGDVAATVTGDRLRLQQVFWNLLNNAVRFTPAGGSVTVGLQVEPGAVRVTVCDTGAGIPEAFQPFVFEAFRQGASSTSGVQRGLGVGLTIAKQLVELHSGTIGFTSAGADCGAEFWVRLPAT
ncbi:MAG: PAS domain-containing sensor histidine kinase [Vicinamibacterales bacterium]